MIQSPFTVVATATKTLQDQYCNDFDGTVKLIGRNNFPCTRLNGHSAAEGLCMIEPGIACKSPWYEQEEAFYDTRNKVVVTNYSMLLMDILYGKRYYLRRPHLLVLDECHKLIDILTDTERIELDYAKLEEVGICPPKKKDLLNVSTLLGWSLDTLQQQPSESWRSTQSQGQSLKKRLLRQKVLSEIERIQMLPTEHSCVIRMDDNTVSLTPLWPTRSYQALMESANVILMMSATPLPSLVLDYLSKLLKGELQNYKQLTLPSPFETWRSPVYYQPVVALSSTSSAQDWSTMSQKVHELIHAREGDKGVVHVASHRQVDMLSMPLLRCKTCRPRLLRLRIGEKREELLRLFRNSSNAILVHPGVGEGESFDDEHCRFQIIAKVKYPDLSDPVIKERSKDPTIGSEYYFGTAARNVVQAVGRGMRHEGDYCETFILDGSFGQLFDRNRSAFPSWFRDLLH